MYLYSVCNWNRWGRREGVDALRVRTARPLSETDDFLFFFQNFAGSLACKHSRCWSTVRSCRTLPPLRVWSTSRSWECCGGGGRNSTLARYLFIIQELKVDFFFFVFLQRGCTNHGVAQYAGGLAQLVLRDATVEQDGLQQAGVVQVDVVVSLLWSRKNRNIVLLTVFNFIFICLSFSIWILLYFCLLESGQRNTNEMCIL